MQKTLTTIQRYFRGMFRSDLTAGLTVAMVVIPQSMAYAAIAGVNPLYGLYTAIIPTVIGALFGSFPYLVTGPTNPTALVTASVLLGYVDRADYLEYVFVLAILAGVFKLILGLLKLGSITRYISNSVLVGFLSAAGVLIILGQLGNLLGIDGSTLSAYDQIWSNIQALWAALQWRPIVVALFSVSVMIGLQLLNRKLPASLITIALATLLVRQTGWAEKGVSLVSSYGLPEQIGLHFHLPRIGLENLGTLAIAGMAVALFGLMESVSIAKAMSQMTGDRLDPSREMIGQGLASFVGGFFLCMPSSGSPSRTVINLVNGAKTRFAAIFSGISVLVFLLVFSGMIGYIPVPALAAVVIISSSGLINFNLIKMTWQSSAQSKVVMALTFFSALFLPLQYAIFLGVLSTILIFLGQSSHINLSYIVENEKGQFIELPMDRIRQDPPRIAIVNVEGDLYFAAVEGLQEELERILVSGIKVLILRFRRTHLLASTGLMALSHLVRTAKNKGVHVLFCGIHDEIEEPLVSSDVMAMIDPSHLFKASNHLFGSTQLALEEAKRILNEENASPSA